MIMFQLILFVVLAQARWQKISSPQDTSLELGDIQSRPQLMLSPAYCVNSNVLLMFGGRATPNATVQSYFADLWQFNITSNKWSHLFGNSSSLFQQPVFGRIGEYSSDVNPGSQIDGVLHCKDDNTVFLLAGYPQSILAEKHFQLNLTSKLWKSVLLQRQDAIAGRVLYRYGQHVAFDPEVGFVLFGGVIYSTLIVADVWIFDVELKIWTCKRDCLGTLLRVGVYGDVGVPGDLLTPGSRIHGAFGYSRNTSSVILFGGYGTTKERVMGYLADTWSYSIAANQWTFMGGSQGHYYMGVNDGTRVFPRSRSGVSNSMSPEGLLLMFGGVTASGASSPMEYLADIWSYNPLRNEWRLLSDGSKDSPERRAGSVGFYSDYYGGLVIMGGESDISQNVDLIEMWVYRHEEVAKLISTTTRAVPKQISVPDAANEPVIYGIIGVAGLISLVSLSAYFYKLYVSRKATAKETYSENYVAKTNFNTWTSGGTTVGVTNEGLEIPGYLEVSPNDFQFIKSISSGGGGDVVLASAQSDYLKAMCITLAVKNLRGCSMDTFYQEVGIMHLLSPCVNIAKMIGYCSQQQMILMKLYSNGSLCDYMSKKNVPTELRLNFARDIANGVYDMHVRFLAHMDLKPQNVLIDIINNRPTCVLTDFGITRILSEELISVQAFQVTEIRGVSLRYASPESMEHFRRKLAINQTPALFTASDIYSLGSIFFYMVCNVHPWE